MKRRSFLKTVLGIELLANPVGSTSQARSGATESTSPLSSSRSVQEVSVTTQTPVRLGEWQELPGTSIAAAWAAWGLPFAKAGGTAENGITRGWTSGAYDTYRHRLILPRGGGHGSWAGNQVVGFNCDTSRWELLQPYSENAWPIDSSIPPPPRFGPVYPDDTPSSMHTYDSIVYLPEQDKVASFGGIWWSATGESVNNVKEWDPALKGGSGGYKWLNNGQFFSDGTQVTSRHTALVWWWGPGGVAGWYRKNTPPPTGYGRKTCWDPTIRSVWLRQATALYLYDPLTDQYTPSGRAVDSAARPRWGTWMQCLVLDNTSRKLYRVYAEDARRAGIVVIDLNIRPGQPGSGEVLLGVADVDVRGDPAGTREMPCDGPGVLFDEDTGQVVIYGRDATGTRGAAYSATPAPGFTWQRIDTGSPRFPPVNVTQGIWKRFFKHRGYYYLVNGWKDNVWRIGTTALANRIVFTGIGSSVVA